MTEARQRSPSPVKVSEDPPAFSRQPLPRFVEFDGRDIDTHVTSYYLKQSRPRYIAAGVPNPIRKPKIGNPGQAASSTSPAQDAEESEDLSDKVGYTTSRNDARFTAINRRTTG